ncbi:hypothetical protein C3V36_11110 [Lachnospiraceae bacterium oral taxon 500]|nr:hypothetical protein C3V36_11110 [Lachnospiraceae bacterium oral taxon 500]
MSEINDLYHCCRWCSYYRNGECQKASDIFENPVEGIITGIVEDGKLSEAIQESISPPEFYRLKGVLNEFNISKKRQQEILKAINTDFEDGITDMVEKVDDTVSTLLYNHIGTELEGMEIKDENEFYCKHFL